MGFSPISNLIFTIVPIIIMIGFIVVFGSIIVTGIRGAKQWQQNNNSPVLSVTAIVVAKRQEMHTHRHHHGDVNHMDHVTTSTTYYVTFEVESGDRMEFGMSGTEYGMLVEGDKGKLTFQGTRYKQFERVK